MANENYDVMASSFPVDTNEASLYEVQAGEQIIATVVVCNQTAGAVDFRVAVAAEAGAAEDSNWIEYDRPCPANESLRVPLVAGPGRDIRIKAASASALSFVLLGCRRSLS
jgi:hypothetical protein